jgi:hypothetical protein
VRCQALRGGFLRSPCHRVFSMFFLFRGTAFFGCGGFETRMAVDCYKLELPMVTVCLPKRKRKGGSVAAAIAGLRGKKMKGFLVNWWFKKYLGFSRGVGLDP